MILENWRRYFLAVLKYASMAIIGLLLLLLIFVGIIHLPPVQKGITGMISDRLTDKIGSSVAIESVRFSLSGKLDIHGIHVDDTHKERILHSERISMDVRIWELFRGDLELEEVRIQDLELKLSRNEQLNIQYIIDAFRNPGVEKKNNTQFEIGIGYIELNTIHFVYESVEQGLEVLVDLGSFSTEKGQLTINPNEIITNNVLLENTSVKILKNSTIKSKTKSTKSNLDILFIPDFTSGFSFRVNKLDFHENEFRFSRGKSKDGPGFDHENMSMEDIFLTLNDLQIDSMSLIAELENLSFLLDGEMQMELNSSLQCSTKSISLKNTGLNAGNSSFTFIADGNKLTDEQHDFGLILDGKIDWKDISYFLPSDPDFSLSELPLTDVNFDGHYFGHQKVQWNRLEITSGDSHLVSGGELTGLDQPGQTGWKALTLKAKIGPGYRRFIRKILTNFDLPPSLGIAVKSSGTPGKFGVRGNLYSDWGDLQFRGDVREAEKDPYLDFILSAINLDAGKFIRQSILGRADLDLRAVGRLSNLSMKGHIDRLEILHDTIYSVDFESFFIPGLSTNQLEIADPDYASLIDARIGFSGPLDLSINGKFEKFSAGKLLDYDSLLSFSGNIVSGLTREGPLLAGFLEGNSIVFTDEVLTYPIDSLVMDLFLSGDSTSFEIDANDYSGHMYTGFPIERYRENFSFRLLSSEHAKNSQREPFDIDFRLANLLPFQLMNLDVDQFSELRVNGYRNDGRLTIEASTENFSGFGMAVDTFRVQLVKNNPSINGKLEMNNLLYDSLAIGDFGITAENHGDTLNAKLLLDRDSIILLEVDMGILALNESLQIFPDRLIALDELYEVNSSGPILLNKGLARVDGLEIKRKDMRILADGNRENFDLSIKNIDLSRFNYLLGKDTSFIGYGKLDADIIYNAGKKIELNSTTDSLIIAASNPIRITAFASTEGQQVPFELALKSELNSLLCEGNYSLENEMLESRIGIDLSDLDRIQYALSDYTEVLKGRISGNIAINGPVKDPDFTGVLHFDNIDLVTSKPRSTFRIPKSSIHLDNSVFLEDFVVFDNDNNPLVVNGRFLFTNLNRFSYDLNIHTENYSLINNPRTDEYKLQGLLSVGADLSLKGNQKDASLETMLLIRDTTDLTYVFTKDNIELISNDGIVEFINPYDTALVITDQSYYDSLIANLPDFNLKSNIVLEEGAVFRVVVDPQSGDYLEASGQADLDFEYNRTGNVKLNGQYEVKKGQYRLSFYDLVKRNFVLNPGSTVKWSGDPSNGDLDILATHTVRSSSLGLVGHEIGENEKPTYKRALPYQIGIWIGGSIQSPDVSFSLDLPREDRVNFPVLASKLDRLKQPEFESELNKQVFGLLVLGGFIPETNVSDLNSNLIATTALTNSVNAILASQLNRFANQYIKGVDIDVGIQSYSDYAAPGGETRTSMDFRVSKSVMDDRLSFEVGGDFDISQDQSGANTGNSFRGDVAIIYDLSGNGDKLLKLFNNETYDIIYHEIRNTGISLIFIREFNREEKKKVN